MNFFHRWCARVTKKHQDAIQSEIEEHKRLLEQARLYDNLCEKAKRVASRWNGVNAPHPMVPPYSKEDIETLVHFVDFKVGGARVDWGASVKKEQDWFVDNGLPIPECNH